MRRQTFEVLTEVIAIFLVRQLKKWYIIAGKEDRNTYSYYLEIFAANLLSALAVLTTSRKILYSAFYNINKGN
jgi:hypothetical protein